MKEKPYINVEEVVLVLGSQLVVRPQRKVVNLPAFAQVHSLKRQQGELRMGNSRGLEMKANESRTQFFTDVGLLEEHVIQSL